MPHPDAAAESGSWGGPRTRSGRLLLAVLAGRPPRRPRGRAALRGGAERGARRGAHQRAVPLRRLALADGAEAGAVPRTRCCSTTAGRGRSRLPRPARLGRLAARAARAGRGGAPVLAVDDAAPARRCGTRLAAVVDTWVRDPEQRADLRLGLAEVARTPTGTAAARVGRMWSTPGPWSARCPTAGASVTRSPASCPPRRRPGPRWHGPVAGPQAVRQRRPDPRCGRPDRPAGRAPPLSGAGPA